MAPTPPRFESIEIPERPSVASERMTAGGKPYLSHTHKGDSGGTTSAPL